MSTAVNKGVEELTKVRYTISVLGYLVGFAVGAEIRDSRILLWANRSPR
jgi:allophanate hydrolase subunit 1